MVFLDLSKLSAPQVYDDGYGIQIHTLNGVLHREDGPAVISPMHQEWYINGVLHREDGPARCFITHPAGGERIVEFWFNGVYTAQACELDHCVFNNHLHKENK